MDFSTLRLDHADHVATVTFTRPERLNAIDEARLADMEAALHAVERDEAVRALVLTGTGRAFCVGLDLDLLERAFEDIPYFESVVRRLAAIIGRIEALSVPTIASINGYTRAGGFETALGCDFIIMADEARIGDAHADSGVVPACVSMRLKRKVGDQRAKDLLFTARWLDGPQAVASGLALFSVPLAGLEDATLRYAATLVDKPAATLRHLKRLLTEGETLSPAEAIELELAAFVRYMAEEPWGREGYRAFRERREPSWRAG